MIVAVSLLMPAIIPYEPRGVLLDGREAIRAALCDLVADKGELLHGVLEGPGLEGTDLDNALLYNIGGRVARVALNGVLLERWPSGSGPGGVRYRYSTTTEGMRRRTGQRPLVLLDGVNIRSRPTSWQDVWRAVRTAPGVQIEDRAPTGEIALNLVIGAPGFTGSANGAFVKTIIDGVLTALHAHRDRVSAQEVGRRMSPKVDLEPPEVAALLVGERRAALGVRDRLVVLRRSGVQCLPEDHRLSAIRIEIDRSTTRWSLDGEVYHA